MALRKPHVWLAAALLIYLLYFFHLTTAGMLKEDEPRYASIGREMARSGDWITPRLWGEPWFEKPALLYWMTGAAFRLGAGEDLAPRLPVALAGAGFLAFFFWILRREFGDRPALFATVMLGTSAAWIGYSQAGVPDIPLAATFSAAVLLSLGWIRRGETGALPCAAAALGLAVLAKGLVPLVLILPVVWAGRRRWRDVLRPAVWGPFLLVALPWYVACYLRNGSPFLEKFFWEHHFARFTRDTLLHSQPVWFYVRVLLAGLFPWTPMLVLLFRKKPREECPALLLVVAFGFVFFSLSSNKLPGYLLPLIPSVAALMGIALAEAVHTRIWFALCSLLLMFIPAIADPLPQALAWGVSRSHFSSFAWAWLLPVLVGVVSDLESERRRWLAVVGTAVAITAGVVYLKVKALPAVDQAVSARPTWREIAARRDEVCVEGMHRSWRYGLNYYSVTPLPDCDKAEKPLHIVQKLGEPPEVRGLPAGSLQE